MQMQFKCETNLKIESKALNTTSSAAAIATASASSSSTSLKYNERKTFVRIEHIV